MKSFFTLAKCSGNLERGRPLQPLGEIIGKDPAARRGKTWQQFIGENSVTLILGVDPNKHCLFIDIEADRIYLDGQRILTTHQEFNYNKGLMLEKNKAIEKRRLKTLKFGNQVLCIDVGFDGRTFFKLFSRSAYSKFRAPPTITYSYWHDRKEAKKKFFAGDLSNPIKEWPVKYYILKTTLPQFLQ